MRMRFRTILVVVFAVLAACSTGRTDCGQPSASTWKMFGRRLGMFVHWGIYSVGGWHEQEQMRRGIPRDEYAKYAERFTAERFSADAFVEHLGLNIWGWNIWNIWNIWG